MIIFLVLFPIARTNFEAEPSVGVAGRDPRAAGEADLAAPVADRGNGSGSCRSSRRRRMRRQ